MIDGIEHINRWVARVGDACDRLHRLQSVVDRIEHIQTLIACAEQITDISTAIEVGNWIEAGGIEHVVATISVVVVAVIAIAVTVVWIVRLKIAAQEIEEVEWTKGIISAVLVVFLPVNSTVSVEVAEQSLQTSQPKLAGIEVEVAAWSQAIHEAAGIRL